MKPLFEKDQKIVCVDRKNKPGEGCGASELIEGKTYVVKNPRSYIFRSSVYIDIYGLKYSYLQTQFVPIDFDKQADSEIREALNENLKIKI